jgi:type VI secretion system secreted protein Hcp
MKVPFAPGSAGQANHMDWIVLESFQFEIERSIAMEQGSMAARAGGVPRFSQIAVSKFLEEASTALLQHLVGYDGGVVIDIHIVIASKKGTDSTLKYRLKDAQVSHYVVSSSGDRPLESLMISYSELEMEFHPHDEGAKSVSTHKFAHNLKAQ